MIIIILLRLRCWVLGATLAILADAVAAVVPRIINRIVQPV